MITLINKFLFLNYKRIWFANSIPEQTKFDFITLRQFSGATPKNWKEIKFFTLLSDLTKTENEIFSQITKTTKYQINRAKRENVKTNTGNIKDFKIFFNNFAPSRNLKKLSNMNIKTYLPYSITTQATYQNTTIAMHLYIIDKQISRARLVYSATLNRDNTNLQLSIIGRANRLLHWEDMIMFKNMGIKTYDWGGIADNTEQSNTKGIDEFKKSFGGIQIQENHYESPNLYKIKKILKK